MKYKILMIINLKAGKAKIEKYAEEIKEKFEESNNYEVKIKYTTKENNATNIIKNYDEDYDILIVCGGDGTLNEAIQGLHDTDKKVFVGYIPVGTTNDFAKSLEVSFDVFDIADNINKYEAKEIDAGLFNDRIFNYVASIGIFSKTSYQTSSNLKNKMGRIAYFFLGVKEVLAYKSFKLKIHSETNVIEDEFLYGSVSNSKYIGGFNLFKNEKVELDDGEFEAIFVRKPSNILKTLKLLIQVLNGNLNNENIYYFKTSELEIKSDEETEWSIDGEYSGKVKNIKISNLNKHIEYILPSKEE